MSRHFKPTREQILSVVASFMERVPLPPCFKPSKRANPQGCLPLQGPPFSMGGFLYIRGKVFSHFRWVFYLLSEFLFSFLPFFFLHHYHPSSSSSSFPPFSSFSNQQFHPIHFFSLFVCEWCPL